MRWRVVGGICGLALAVILILPVNGGAQGLLSNSFQNWNFLGGGARSRAMGGAFIGVSDDAYAGSWNPAGLVYNEGVLLALNYSYAHIGLGLDNAPMGRPLQSVSQKTNLGSIPSASFVAPLNLMGHEFILNAYYNRLQDVSGAGVFAADVDPIFGSPFRANYQTSGNVAIAAAAFGTVITKRLTFGGTFGVVTGDGSESHQMDLDSLRDTTAWFQNVRWFDQSDLGYQGVMLTVGGMYRADRWTVGLTASPGWTLTQSVDYKAGEVMYHNRIPELVPIQGYILAPLKGTKREIDIPYTVALGGSYHIRDNFLVAADYQYRAFHRNSTQSNGTSGFRIQEEPTEPEAAFVSLPTDWYNLHQVRLGMEYKWETPWGTFPVRCGIRNEPMLIGDNARTSAVFEQRIYGNEVDGNKPSDAVYFLPLSMPQGSSSQTKGWTLAVGSGVHWSQVRLDLTLEWTGYSYKESGSLSMIERCDKCPDPEVDPTVTVDRWGKRKRFDWGDYTRTYDNNRVRLMLNFTGYF